MRKILISGFAIALVGLASSLAQAQQVGGVQLRQMDSSDHHDKDGKFGDHGNEYGRDRYSQNHDRCHYDCGDDRHGNDWDKSHGGYKHGPIQIRAL